MNKNNLNVVKCTIIATFGKVAEDNGVEFTEEQDKYMDDLVSSLIVHPSIFPENVKPNDYVISKIQEIISFLDELWERHERLQDLED